MPNPDDLFTELETQTTRVEEKFVRSYVEVSNVAGRRKYAPLDPTMDQAEYDLDVRAYCVISHAAIEHFVERIAIELLEAVKSAWNQKNPKASHILQALIAFYGITFDVERDKNLSTTTYGDHIRGVLDKLSTRFSNDVNRNHGVSIEYLRKLLYPVAIDITTDPDQLSSLAQLTKHRGKYAHEFAAIRPITPEEALEIVTDCVKLCRDIRDKAKDKIAECA